MITIANVFDIKYGDLIMFNHSVFKFTAELLSAKMKIRADDSDQEKTKSIYKQMKLFPKFVSLESLGWIIALFFKEEFPRKPIITFVYIVSWVLGFSLSIIGTINLPFIYLWITMICIMGLCGYYVVSYLVSFELRKKIMLLFSVLKELGLEKPLAALWPLSAYYKINNCNNPFAPDDWLSILTSK